MRTDFSRDSLEAFVLDEKQVRSLAKILQDYAGEPSISVDCTDHATRSFESVDELLEYENAKSRRITSLSLRSYTFTGSHLLEEREDARIDAAWGGPQTFRSTRTAYISVRVSGTEERASITKRELDEVIAGSRPWYSWVSKINEVSLWLLFYVILSFLLFQFGETSWVRTPLNILTAAGLSIWPAWGVSWVLRRLFPLGVFLIGQEKGRYRTKEWLRKLVIGTMVTVIITWLATLSFRSLWPSL